MFELEREVVAWIDSVYAARCSSAAGAVELRDHLYCEIDREKANGASDEEAFATAVSRVGAAPDLAAEDAKDRTWLSAGCAAARRIEPGTWTASQRRLLISHGVLWAAVMIAAALLLKQSAGAATSEWFILLILIPCWLGSEQILREALRRSSGGKTR